MLGFKIHLQRFLVYSYFRYIETLGVLQLGYYNNVSSQERDSLKLRKLAPAIYRDFFQLKVKIPLEKKNIILLLLFLLNTLIVEFLSRSGAKIQIK